MKIDFLKNSKKTLEGHMNDLRMFFILLMVIYLVIFFICFYFAENFYLYLAIPMIEALKEHNISTNFIITGITEVFYTYIKIAFYVASIIFIPILLLLVTIFLKPVFKRKINKILYIIIFLIPSLFLLGVLLAYYLSLEVIWDFFIKFSLIDSNLNFLPSLKEYIALALNIILAFGVSFELPVVLLILSLLGILDEKSLIKFSRYAIVGAFIIGAIFTPPDPFSQIIIASILIVLYYASYFLIKYVNIIKA